MGVEMGRENVLFMHLTLVPYIPAGRDKDQADAAFGQRAALDRHPAGRTGLPGRPSCT